MRFGFALMVILFAIPLDAADVNYRVSRDAGGQLVVTSTELTNRGEKRLDRRLHSVQLRCDSDVTGCDQFTVRIAARDICDVPPNQTVCDGTLLPDQIQNGELLTVRRGNTNVFETTLRTSSDDGAGDARTTELANLLQTPCEEAIAAELDVLDLENVDRPAESSTYSRSRNQATFVVDVLGNVLAAPTENVDENDTLFVRVMADTRLHRFLKVRRKSAIRTITNRIVGTGLEVPIAQTGAQNLGPEDVTCGPKEFVLTDFNPGKGEVEIQAVVGTRTQSLGTFEFVVDPLYNGIFSLGTATSDLSDREFKLRTVGDKQFIYATEEGDTTKYVVYFTPFLRARDIEKSGQRFWEHINPTFGISTQETGNNAYAGISIDYKGFIVSGGWHFARINDLASSSELQEGSEFAGAEADIPQAKRWENDRFIGISIDLRSAVELFRTLVSGAGGGGS